MSKHTRLTRRKKQIFSLLKAHRPQGISTLNELRVKSMWEDGGVVGSRAHADHRKSFNRTLLKHGEPFDVYDLSRTYEGIPENLTAGIFARWAIWEFIERGFLYSEPQSNEQFELYMGYDACTGVIRNAVSDYAVVGNCCFLRSLYLVAENFTELLLEEISACPWVIYGINSENSFELISGDTPVWGLNKLPASVALPNGHCLSMSKISPTR